MSKLNIYPYRRYIAFACASLAIFALLVYLFPYSGDDWAWGSEIGLDRLRNHFEGYNGRYAGNLLVMALTRSKALNIIITAFSLVCACFIPLLFTGSKRFATLPAAFALLLLTPKSIWVQSVVWTAGFSNYVPPIILLMVYLITVRSVFEQDEPKYGKFAPVFAAIGGFACTLFMENVTLYALALSACVIIFAFIKFREFFAVNIAHFVGSAAGAILMFSNSAYSAIANAKDGYRSTAMSEGLLKTVINHTTIIAKQFFTDNIPMLAVVTALCAALVFIFVRRNGSDHMKKVAVISVCVNTVSFMIILCRRLLAFRVFADLCDKLPGRYFSAVFYPAVLLYSITVLAVILICIRDKTVLAKSLFLLGGIPVLMAPLLVVNPIGPRCFFPPYFVGIVFCVFIFNYIADIAPLGELKLRKFTAAFSAVGAAMLVFMLCIYIPIHSCDIKRNEYAVKQAEAGCKTVKLCKLPHGSYVWTGEPDKEPWSTRYKLFHGIDGNVTFEFLDRAEFDKWASDFDAKTK